MKSKYHILLVLILQVFWKLNWAYTHTTLNKSFLLLIANYMPYQFSFILLQWTWHINTVWKLYFNIVSHLLCPYILAKAIETSSKNIISGNDHHVRFNLFPAASNIYKPVKIWDTFYYKGKTKLVRRPIKESISQGE